MLELNKKTLKNLFLIVAGAIVLYWILNETERVKSVLVVAKNIFSPFVLGAALGLAFLPMGPEASLCGIVIGVSVGNLVRTGLQLSFVPKHITGLDWKPSLRRIIRMFVTVALIAAPCLIFIDPPRRFFTWVMYACMLVIYASVITFAVTWLFDRKVLKSLFGRFMSLVSRFAH